MPATTPYCQQSVAEQRPAAKPPANSRLLHAPPSFFLHALPSSHQPRPTAPTTNQSSTQSYPNTTAWVADRSSESYLSARSSTYADARRSVETPGSPRTMTRLIAKRQGMHVLRRVSAGVVRKER